MVSWSLKLATGGLGLSRTLLELWKKSKKAKFEYGWKAFAQDSDLKVGDVCVFVLSKSIEISFEVAIFGENETEKSVV